MKFAVKIFKVKALKDVALQDHCNGVNLYFFKIKRQTNLKSAGHRQRADVDLDMFWRNTVMKAKKIEKRKKYTNKPLRRVFMSADSS